MWWGDVKCLLKGRKNVQWDLRPQSLHFCVALLIKHNLYLNKCSARRLTSKLTKSEWLARSRSQRLLNITSYKSTGRRIASLSMNKLYENKLYSQFCIQLKQEALLIVHWGRQKQRHHSHHTGQTQHIALRNYVNIAWLFGLHPSLY